MTETDAGGAPGPAGSGTSAAGGRRGGPGAGTDEFSLIETILAEQPGDPHPEDVLGAGDDGALVAPPPGHQLVLSVDTLLEGVHFLPATPPALAVHRALAVNLSDLAAMGATPGPCLLALTHPALTPAVARAVGRGFAAGAAGTGARLVGGNLARGPFSITVTVCGWVPSGAALTRAGARDGDLLCVSGVVGAGAAGLASLRAAPERLAGLETVEDADAAVRAYLAPVPRLALGEALRGLATACIDVSDGLLADLGHLASASGLGAELELGRVPAIGPAADAVTAGDDYELLFTVPAGRGEALEALAAELVLPLTVVGRMVEAPGLRLLVDGRPVPAPGVGGWRHFA